MQLVANVGNCKQTNQYNSLALFAAEASLGEIPDASQLSGINEFRPLQPPSESQSSIAQLLSVLRERVCKTDHQYWTQ